MSDTTTNPGDKCRMMLINNTKATMQTYLPLYLRVEKTVKQEDEETLEKKCILGEVSIIAADVV